MPPDHKIIPIRSSVHDRATLAAALRRTGAGDRAAFEEVYRRTSAKLFSVCLRILPGRQEAEEALQEAYLAIWRRAATFDEARGGAMAWLITLTRNRAVDRLRAGGRLESAPIDLAAMIADPAPDAEALLASEGEAGQLMRCLGTLDPPDARLIRTAFFEGSTYAERNGAARLPDMTDDDLTAAELAFGLLDPGDALAAEQRVESDSRFAQLYARWIDKAAVLAGSGAEEPPRPSLWGEIVARLPANDTAAAAPSVRTVRWWQGGTAVAASLALVFGVVALERPAPPAPAPAAAPAAAPAPPLVAMLSARSGNGLVTISFDPSTGRVMSAPHATMPRGNHVPELWVIPADGKPRSLGVIAAGAPGWMRAASPAMPMVAPGVTLAISVEPLGGSPTGTPTGPVIMSGTVTTT